MLEQLGRIDLYLLDQLMKNRISSNMRILDAGCGSGRNAQYFIQNGYQIWGFDKKEDAVLTIQENVKFWNPKYDFTRFQLADLASLPYADAEFDLIISSAVLHFAENRTQFIQWITEMIRVLKPNGILWFRMTTKHTLIQHAQHLYDDVYTLGDGSTRYLLDLKVLSQLMEKYQLHFLDPFKTVNVSDLRTMAVVVLQKQ